MREQRSGDASIAAWLITIVVAVFFQWLSATELFSMLSGPLAAWGACVGVVSVVLFVSSQRITTSSLGWVVSIFALLAAGTVYAARFPASDRIGAAVVLASLLTAGTFIGAALGSRVMQAGYLVAVAYISTVADLFSVFSARGPSAAIVKDETLLGVLALPWPVLGTQNIIPLLGVGDVVMTALYFAAVRLHRLSIPKTAFALALAYAGTFWATAVFDRALPALPLMGLAIVLAHPEARRLPESERKQGYVGMGLVSAVFLFLALSGSH